MYIYIKKVLRNSQTGVVWSRWFHINM